MDIWTILRTFDIFGVFCGALVYRHLPVLVSCTEKYLAGLADSREISQRWRFGRRKTDLPVNDDFSKIG
jgi:hypothetical protein